MPCFIFVHKHIHSLGRSVFKRRSKFSGFKKHRYRQILCTGVLRSVSSIAINSNLTYTKTFCLWKIKKKKQRSTLFESENGRDVAKVLSSDFIFYCYKTNGLLTRYNDDSGLSAETTTYVTLHEI